MQQEIIVQKMTIHRRAQVHYFQVNIPGNVTSISGVQIGLRVDGSPVAAGQQWQAGTLTLQAQGKMNLCYNLAVMAEPPVTPRYDLGLTVEQAGFPAPTALIKDAIAQRYSTSYDPVTLPKCRMIYGVYRDGNQWQAVNSYELTLTLWTQADTIAL